METEPENGNGCRDFRELLFSFVVFLFVWLFFCSSLVCFLFVYFCVCLWVSLFLCLVGRLSFCFVVSLVVCLFVCLFGGSFVFVCLLVCLVICLVGRFLLFVVFVSLLVFKFKAESIFQPRFAAFQIELREKEKFIGGGFRPSANPSN